MPRFFVAAAAAALLVVAAAPAFADKAPDAAQIRAAAEQFDAGVIAYKQKDFEGAASRFEAADAAVPGAKTLRQAIRARMEAGQGARAATLAAQAIERYPTDDATTKLAKETIAKVEPLVQKLSISCA
jgi:outer membrane protein assembly factor BamD (BamD/ComL family)